MKLDQIFSHPKNPRKQLIVDELAESIKESGLLCPLLIRRIGFEKFEIISGHRRKEALIAMGETYADCDVVEMNDEQAYKALMTANIQTHSLSEIEEAEGIKHMIDVHQWTQERVAKEFGKSQNWVNMRLGLLRLEKPVQELIIARAINTAQARYINNLPAENQEEIAHQVVSDGLSSRETAELVKQLNSPRNEKISTPHFEGNSNSHQIDDKLTSYQNDSQSNNHEIQDSSKTSCEFRSKLDEPKKEEKRLYSDPDMKQISEMNGFILKLKDIEIDLQPHGSVMDTLVEFNRDTEALNELAKIEFRINWMRKHISNARARLEGSSSEGTVLEFKRREA